MMFISLLLLVLHSTAGLKFNPQGQSASTKLVHSVKLSRRSLSFAQLSKRAMLGARTKIVHASEYYGQITIGNPLNPSWWSSTQEAETS